MSDDLARIETWVGGLIDKLDAGGRRKLARAVAVDLRRAQARRIAAQQNPDGSPFEPRKRDGAAPIRNRPGQVRRRAKARRGGPMFKALRTTKYLRANWTENEATVGMANPTAARIARVHQDGLRDRVTRQSDSPTVRYPQRMLLGFTDEDRGRLLDLVLKHLA